MINSLGLALMMISTFVYCFYIYDAIDTNIALHKIFEISLFFFSLATLGVFLYNI